MDRTNTGRVAKERRSLLNLQDKTGRSLTGARIGSHIPRRIVRNDGRESGREPSSPDDEEDRLPPRRENGLKKRAKAMDRTAPPWKDVIRPGSNEKIK